MNHLAIIADGNRRWAAQHGLPFEFGYQQGLTVIERTCDWAIQNNVKFLSFYCFSTENWSRPQEQVDSLFQLADNYFGNNVSWYVQRGIKVQFAGRRDRLKQSTTEKISHIEEATEKGEKLCLVIYIDYGGRDEIVRAIEAGARSELDIDQVLAKTAPYPDMILRTGGEKRLSNFMLWQAAYAELCFLDSYFPELDCKILDQVKEEYQSRKRNFGK